MVGNIRIIGVSEKVGVSEKKLFACIKKSGKALGPKAPKQIEFVTIEIFIQIESGFIALKRCKL